jgi:hypothetical protein
VINEVKAKTPLDAETALIDWALFYTLYINDFIAADAQIYRAANTTIWADCFDMVCWLFVVFGNKGAGWASGDALATGYAD